MLQIAWVTSGRSTCSRRRVGCVITDSDNHIISTGYNGVPKDMVHCSEELCPGANYAVGEGLDICKAIHAEINAIAHCRDIKNAKTLYVTTSPCMSCIKAIAATNIRKIFYTERYLQEPLDYFESIGGEAIYQGI